MVTIPDIDETTVRAIALTLAVVFETKDPQRAMAVAMMFQDYIDPLSDRGYENKAALEKQP